LSQGEEAISLYSDEDRANALLNHLPLVGSDVEINANLQGDDVVVRVNKAGVLVCRIRLKHAGREIAGEALSAFSTFAPDFAFTIGDTADGITRLKRAVGL